MDMHKAYSFQMTIKKQKIDKQEMNKARINMVIFSLTKGSTLVGPVCIYQGGHSFYTVRSSSRLILLFVGVSFERH